MGVCQAVVKVARFLCCRSGDGQELGPKRAAVDETPIDVGEVGVHERVVRIRVDGLAEIVEGLLPVLDASPGAQ